MKKSFVHSAFILVIAAGINRILGFSFQAVIYRLIGPEGIGLFNLVYPIYILIIVIATAGIPLGISKLVSEAETTGNHRRSLQILGLALCILILTGVFFTTVSYFASPLLLKYVFVNKMVYPVFLSLIPGILVVSISSVFRGFFQGLMNMKPPALAQVVEQVVRVITGVTAAIVLLPKGIQWAAAGISAASILGEASGLLLMLHIFFKQTTGYARIMLPDRKSAIDILKQLFNLCTPITIGRIAATLMLSLDSVLIPLLLKNSGLNTQEATSVYGQLTGVALTLLFIPSVITISLATSLVPAISESVAQKRLNAVRLRTSKAVQLTILAGIPFISAFLTLPSQITQIVFGSAQSGSLLYALSFGGIFAYIQQTTTGVLQGLGFPGIPVRNMLLSCLFKIGGFYWLTSIPGFEIAGIAYGYVIFFIISAVLNIMSLYNKTGYSPHLINNIIKPIFAGLVTSIAFYHIYQQTYFLTGSLSIRTAVTLVSGFSIYMLTAFILGVLKKSDFNRIPLFQKFIKK